MGEMKYGNEMRCNNKKGGMNQSSFGKMGKKEGVEKTKSRQTESDYNNNIRL